MLLRCLSPMFLTCPRLTTSDRPAAPGYSLLPGGLSVTSAGRRARNGLGFSSSISIGLPYLKGQRRCQHREMTDMLGLFQSGWLPGFLMMAVVVTMISCWRIASRTCQ
jgi:hypothetical protein